MATAQKKAIHFKFINPFMGNLCTCMINAHCTNTWMAHETSSACCVFVFRINKGPTVGYERDVGSKTTHRIIYPESAVDMEDQTHLVLLPFKILDLQWLISVFTTKHIDQWESHIISLFILLVCFVLFICILSFVHRTYTYVRPSIKADKSKVDITMLPLTLTLTFTFHLFKAT